MKTKWEQKFIDWDNKTNSNASQRQIIDWFKSNMDDIISESSSLPPQPGRGAEDYEACIIDIKNTIRSAYETDINEGWSEKFLNENIEGAFKDIMDCVKIMQEYRTQSDKDMYPEWQNPKDEKPEVGKLVLLKVTNNKAFVGYYHRYGHWIIISRDSSYKENDLHQVTAWAYVPEW